jgi:hypothetical protein
MRCFSWSIITYSLSSLPHIVQSGASPTIVAPTCGGIIKKSCAQYEPVGKKNAHTLTEEENNTLRADMALGDGEAWNDLYVAILQGDKILAK